MAERVNRTFFLKSGGLVSSSDTTNNSYLSNQFSENFLLVHCRTIVKLFILTLFTEHQSSPVQKALYNLKLSKFLHEKAFYKLGLCRRWVRERSSTIWRLKDSLRIALRSGVLWTLKLIGKRWAGDRSSALVLHAEKYVHLPLKVWYLFLSDVEKVSFFRVILAQMLYFSFWRFYSTTLKLWICSRDRVHRGKIFYHLNSS